MFVNTLSESGCCRNKYLPSLEIWRQRFKDLVGEDIYLEVTRAVEEGLDRAYPSQAPWDIIHYEYKYKWRYLRRDWLQVTKEIGPRQPTHWDTSCPWFENARGHWAPLSVVLHLNDGLSTYLPGPPVDCFTEMRERYKAGLTPDFLAKALVKLLDKYDVTDHNLTHRPRSRAGQCLAFHSGQQVHAGMGWDGVVDPVNPDMCGRVVSYFFALPRLHQNLWRLPFFNPEEPWGLMGPGVTTRMVFLLCSLFLGSKMQNMKQYDQKKNRPFSKLREVGCVRGFEKLC